MAAIRLIAQVVVLLLAGGMVYAAADEGVTVTTVFSVLVLALFAFGILGALR